MISNIPRPVKLGLAGLSPDEIRNEQYDKESLYKNEHLEDKVVGEPYLYTEKMRFHDNYRDHIARLDTKARLELIGQEMEHYLNHVPLQEVDICIFCSRDREFCNDKQNKELA